MLKHYQQWIKSCFFTFIFLISALINQLNAKKNLFGKVTLPLGKVMVLGEEKQTWQKAKFNQSVFNNEKIKTLKKSRCEVKIDKTQIVRIGENAVIRLENPNDKDNGIFIESGHAWLNAKPGKGQKVRVRTPTAVAAIRGTIYRLDCTTNHSTFNVYDGNVEVTPFKEDGITLEDTSFNVKKGESFTLVKDFEKYKKEQQKALREFQKKQQSDFDSFMKEQSDGFKKFKTDQLKGFAKFKSGHFTRKKIDKKADRSSEWVKWNRKRDRLNK
ncbi:MAG: hypothetical protein CMG60_06235 [Candidatus Marinimicrobia bacterium]|mgnify:CR=1 FL=1|nr:hypothetical protein [Candidatus Neomarinimicrobiota bacterium]|tara:strand:- start:1561 stop:2373 length:813 start_codon:yes stop_codon:yes gene_type:complete